MVGYTAVLLAADDDPEPLDQTGFVHPASLHPSAVSEITDASSDTIRALDPSLDECAGGISSDGEYLCVWVGVWLCVCCVCVAQADSTRVPPSSVETCYLALWRLVNATCIVFTLTHQRTVHVDVATCVHTCGCTHITCLA